MSNTDEKKLEGGRRAVRQHIAKFNEFKRLEDKRFALRSISIAQNEIASVRRQHPQWPKSDEDDWEPTRGWEKDAA
jgi:hypothetical protein